MSTVRTTKRSTPIRSCVICGRKCSKRELMRIVSRSEGGILVDPTGKMNGRGAYVCKDGSCSGKGLKRERLEYKLRTKVAESEWAKLLASVETLTATD